MLLQTEREQIVVFGRKLIESRLTTGTGGNLSIFDREKGLYAIKPSGVEYKDITAIDVVVMDLDGKIVDGRNKPSSEHNMHRILYQNRPDINAVIHTHSVYSTTLACLGRELPAAHYLVGFGGGNKIPLAPYATFGSQELAQYACDAMDGYYGVLLANHGLLTAGGTIEYAFSAAEEIELCAEIYWRALAVGEPNILTEKQMDDVLSKFSTYGQPTKTS